jgi:hypothetical protein
MIGALVRGILAMLVRRVCNQLLMVKQLLLGLHLQNLEVSFITNRLSIRLLKIHHRPLWVFGACIQSVAYLADIVKEDVSEKHLYQVEIQFFGKMLCDR